MMKCSKVKAYHGDKSTLLPAVQVGWTWWSHQWLLVDLFTVIPCH